MSKKRKNIGGQSPQGAQGAQAPQGSRSTFGRKDSAFMPNIKKKKPLKRGPGVGSKSTKQKIKEYGQKKKREEQLNESTPVPLEGYYKNYKGTQPTEPSAKKPLKRFCGGKSKPFKRKKY